ncbi:MAG TPA: amino acid adenylation domain-containing protein [Bacilli bacterium]|nr:amino acid adenylation domain-containing protein [Bacilli bacterium]
METITSFDLWQTIWQHSRPVVELPTSFSRVQSAPVPGPVIEQAVPPSVADLEQPDLVLLTAFLSFLYRYTGCEELLSGHGSLTPEHAFSELVQDLTLLEKGSCSATADAAPTLSVYFGRTSDLAASVERFAAAPSLELAVLVEWSNEPKLHWLYDGSLFSEERIARMQANFHVLLEAAVHAPDTPICRLPVLSEPEQQQLASFRGETIPYPDDCPIQQLFEEQADRVPARAAVRYQGQELTYGELEARANRVAHFLKAQGYGRGMRVALVLEHSLEKVEIILGVLKAGCAYVPIDPELPQARIEYLLEDCAPAVVLTHRHLLTRVDNFAGDVLAWEDRREAVAACTATRPTSVNSPEDAAYIIYTSGSTGKPKGTVLSHEGLCHFAIAQAVPYGMHEDSRILQFASFSFDVSVMETFFALVRGACVVLAPVEELVDPALLAQLMERERITFAVMSPSMLSQLSPQAGSALECLVSGGEVCPPRVAEAWREHLHFINAYGPTEATVCSTAWSARSVERVPTTLPIGKPLPNCEVLILDRWQQPVPIGVTGELYISEPGLALGYLHRPELTAERFLPHPTNPGARMYRTGDLARYLPSGDVDFLGRADDQVKIRGYRIELQEIEAVLTAHEAVREAVVLAWTDPQEEKNLVAYLVLRRQVPTETIWSYLRDTLPKYMVPGYLIVLPRFPIAPTGKVDRKALPVPDGEAERHTPFVPPQTEAERGMAAIWEDVLKVQPIGLEDHFFETGGHSLKAAQVIARVKERFGVKLSAKQLFHHPTLQAFTALLGEAKGSLERTSIPTLPPQESYELSHAQKRLWHFAQLEPELPVYNVMLALQLTGDLDRAALNQALEQVVERHDALRTSFPTRDGQPVQVIAEAMDVRLDLIDLAAQADLASDKLLQDLHTEELNRGFDLACGPLWRARLVKLADREHVLVFTVHHIVFDGWSNGLFLEELGACYRAATRGERAQLPALTIRYADYAAWHNGRLADGGLAEQQAYWHEQLSGELPLLELPTDYPRPPVQSHRGATCKRTLSPETVRKLRAFCQQRDVTPFMLITAALQALLSRYSGQEDIILGAPVAGRTEAQLESLVGMFVNTVAVRSRLSSAMTFAELTRDVQQTLLTAYEHQDYPFDRLVEELVTTRDLSRHPIFSVMVVQEPLDVPQSMGELHTALLEADVRWSKFDLTFFLLEAEGAPDTIRLAIEYATDLFRAETVERMLGHLNELLTAALQAPDTPLGHLPLLPARERQALLPLPPVTKSAEVLDLKSRWEAQAARVPDAVALTFGDTHLTYSEVNTRANALAHLLRQRGVTANTPVALLLERSAEMIVSILAVVKAGGFYVPLDPDYPEERLRYMVQDSGARVLLTTSSLQRLLPDVESVLALDDLAVTATLAQASTDNPPTAHTADDLLYVIYTSGSTGRPKGVLLTHANVGRLFDAAEAHFDFHERDVWTFFHSYCFDFSVWEMYGALLYGGRVVIVSADTARDPEAFRRLLLDEGVTVLNQTPSAFYRLLETDASSAHPGRLDAHLRYVIFGGEALNVSRLQGWYERYQDAPLLVNMYGITETTVHVTFRALSPDDLHRPWKGSPIGQPLDDLRVYLLDANGQPVPQGVPGEIHVAGAGLAVRYLNNPEKTNEVFRHSDLPELAGVRLYKTGDIARYNADGELEHMGRADGQVKVRGYRIELGEVEAALLKLGDVRHALARVLRDAADQPQLIAFAETDATRTDGEWRSRLRDFLPDYMLPSRLIALPAFPLTGNGKVDHKRLLERAATDLPEAKEWPSTPTQQALAAIWEDLLPVEEVGIHDNFFAVGGHSLNAGQLLTRIHDRFGIELTYRDVFAHATIAELETLLAPQDNVTSDWLYAFDMQIGDEVATFYLTPAEFEEQGAPEGAFHLRKVNPNEEEL